MMRSAARLMTINTASGGQTLANRSPQERAERPWCQNQPRPGLCWRRYAVCLHRAVASHAASSGELSADAVAVISFGFVREPAEVRQSEMAPIIGFLGNA